MLNLITSSVVIRIARRLLIKNLKFKSDRKDR